CRGQKRLCRSSQITSAHSGLWRQVPPSQGSLRKQGKPWRNCMTFTQRSQYRILTTYTPCADRKIWLGGKMASEKLALRMNDLTNPEHPFWGRASRFAGCRHRLQEPSVGQPMPICLATSLLSDGALLPQSGLVQ